MMGSHARSTSTLELEKVFLRDGRMAKYQLTLSKQLLLEVMAQRHLSINLMSRNRHLVPKSTQKYLTKVTP
nr:MAG: hypothetical protein J07AB56_12100 [Candidatus Nanosalinarum sp. J07AB56]